jgi:hypothetical protein
MSMVSVFTLRPVRASPMAYGAAVGDPGQCSAGPGKLPITADQHGGPSAEPGLVWAVHQTSYNCLDL